MTRVLIWADRAHDGCLAGHVARGMNGGDLLHGGGTMRAAWARHRDMITAWQGQSKSRSAGPFLPGTNWRLRLDGAGSPSRATPPTGSCCFSARRKLGRPYPWQALEQVPGLLRGRGWVLIGGAYSMGSTPGSLDEHLKKFLTRATAGWVAIAWRKHK